MSTLSGAPDKDEFMSTAAFMLEVEDDIGTQQDLIDNRMTQLIEANVNTVKEIAVFMDTV
jgi:hypothetical protein